MTLQKILLIDDDEAFHFLHISTLRESGIMCPIDSAADGQEALNYLDSCGSEMPNLILLDINMPGMGGLDFLAAYQNSKTFNGSAKVFMLTSSEIEEDKVIAFSFPCVKGYLEKPLSMKGVGVILSNFATDL